MKNTKKASLFLIISVMTAFCLVFSAGAAWEKISEDSNIEQHYDNVTGTLYIKGEGKLNSFLTEFCCDLEEGDYYYDEINNNDFSHLYDIKTIIIEEGITEIGHCTFLGDICGTELLKNLETVVLPESLEKIGDYAFNRCPKLTRINFPSNLKSIGKFAFFGTNLPYLHLPESVEEIGEGAFSGCNNLKSAVFTNATCSMINCNSLAKIVYPESITKVSTLATSCANLKEVIFQNIKSINKVKVSAEDTNKFFSSCKNAVLGYLDEEIIPELEKKNISYVVVSNGVSKLSNVKDFKHIQNSAKNDLKWSEVDGAGYYQLYYYKGGKWVKVYSGTSTSYENPVSGKYRVRAVNYNGEKYVYSKYTTMEVNVVGSVSFESVKISGRNVTLKWNKVSGITGYQVYYSTKEGSGYKKAATTSNISYVVKNLTKGKTYYFKVRGYYKYADNNVIYGTYSDVTKVKI